jgi:hypothetical protein
VAPHLPVGPLIRKSHSAGAISPLQEQQGACQGVYVCVTRIGSDHSHGLPTGKVPHYHFTDVKMTRGKLKLTWTGA